MQQTKWSLAASAHQLQDQKEPVTLLNNWAHPEERKKQDSFDPTQRPPRPQGLCETIRSSTSSRKSYSFRQHSKAGDWMKSCAVVLKSEQVWNVLAWIVRSRIRNRLPQLQPSTNALPNCNHQPSRFCASKASTSCTIRLSGSLELTKGKAAAHLHVMRQR